MTKMKFKLPVVFALVGATTISSLLMVSAKPLTNLNESKSDGSANDESGISQNSGKLEEYREKAAERCQTKIAEMIEEGKITQEQADEYYTKFTEFVENFEGTGRGFKFTERDEESENTEKGTRIKSGISLFDNGTTLNFSMFDEKILEILGMTQEEFDEALKENNDSWYAVIENSGKIDEYKEYILSAAKQKIQDLIDSGKITQEQSDNLLSKAEEMLEKFNSGDMITKSKPFMNFDENFEGFDREILRKHKNFDSEESDVTMPSSKTSKLSPNKSI